RHLRNEANSVPSAPPSADPQHPPTTKLPNEPNFARNRLQTKPICLLRRTRFHPNPTATPPLIAGPFAPLVILAFPMLRVRFAPFPIGLEPLGRETCLRRMAQAIGKLKTS